MSDPAESRIPSTPAPLPLVPEALVGRAVAILQRTQRTVLDSLRLAGHALSRIDRLVADVGRDGREVVESAIALWRAVEGAFEQAALTARATPRVARILKEIGRIATVYRLYHIKRPWLSPESAARELDALHRREAQRLRLALEELGGGVLKVGQFLSCRADLLPASWIDELKLLQDSVPPAPEADVKALLLQELQALWPRDPAPTDLDAWFESFEATPVAAASLAQVHRATLRDRPGHAVAVKVQRPRIDEVIAQDRRALAIIAELLAPLFEEIALAPILAEIGRSLDAELDFAAEADNARRFAAIARVPAIVASTPRLVVMDFVDGERLVPFLDAATAAGDDARLAERDRVLEALAKTTADAILVHGLVHADPHPGNFLVARDASGAPELVILDFGAMVALGDEARRAVVGLLPAMFGRNEARTRELLAVLGFSAPDPDAPAKFALSIAATLVPSDLATIDPRAELERGLALAREYPGMVVPGAFVQIGRSLAGLGGLFLTYRPALNLGALLMASLGRA